MSHSRGPSRRDLLAGAATAVAASGLAGARHARAAPPVLRIAQWAHFVPGYDEWFDRKFAPEWAERNGITVEVDHLTLSELRARADTEVATRQRPRPLRVPRFAGRLRGARDTPDRRRDRVRAPIRAPSGLRASRHVQSTDEAVLRRPGELGARAAPLPKRPVGGDGHQARHLGARAGGRAQDPREAGGSGRVRARARARQQLGPSRSPLGVRGRRAGRGGAGHDQLSGRGRSGQADVDHLPRVDDLRRVHVGCGLQQPSLRVGTGLHHSERDLRHPEHGEEQSGTRQEGGPGAARGRSRRAPRRGERAPLLRGVELLGQGRAREALPDRPRGGGRGGIPRKRVLQPAVLPPDAARTSSRSSARARPARPGNRGPSRPDRYALLAEADRWSALPGHPGYVTPAVDETLQRGVIPAMFARAARGEQSPEASVRAAEVEMRRIFARWAK